ncbi:uncharacterized protein LOC131642952 [Vicia villosa]|uniref:uncharacterized protein LOC131642952 n=1 Tax=Vicia villosa TaxID=3911 RepID=UPI00273B8AA5|nr:uncharacterized protein LOC131642952 [Vicia villosa]
MTSNHGSIWVTLIQALASSLCEQQQQQVSVRCLKTNSRFFLSISFSLLFNSIAIITYATSYVSGNFSNRNYVHNSNDIFESKSWIDLPTARRLLPVLMLRYNQRLMEIWRVKEKRLTCGEDVEDSSMEARRREPSLKAASKQGMKAFPLPPSFVFCNLEVTEHWLPSPLLCNYGTF